MSRPFMNLFKDNVRIAAIGQAADISNKITIELLSVFPWFQISKFEIPYKDLMK